MYGAAVEPFAGSEISDLAYVYLEVRTKVKNLIPYEHSSQIIVALCHCLVPTNPVDASTPGTYMECVQHCLEVIQLCLIEHGSFLKPRSK